MDDIVKAFSTLFIGDRDEQLVVLTTNDQEASRKVKGPCCKSDCGPQDQRERRPYFTERSFTWRRNHNSRHDVGRKVVAYNQNIHRNNPGSSRRRSCNTMFQDISASERTNPGTRMNSQQHPRRLSRKYRNSLLQENPRGRRSSHRGRRNNNRSLRIIQEIPVWQHPGSKKRRKRNRHASNIVLQEIPVWHHPGSSQRRKRNHHTPNTMLEEIPVWQHTRAPWRQRYRRNTTTHYNVAEKTLISHRSSTGRTERKPTSTTDPNRAVD